LQNTQEVSGLALVLFHDGSYGVFGYLGQPFPLLRVPTIRIDSVMTKGMVSVIVLKDFLVHTAPHSS
jgi:hypothetical protein